MMEFNSVAELHAHYKAVRQRLVGTPPPLISPPSRRISPPRMPKSPPDLSKLSVQDYLRHLGRPRTDLTFLNVLAVVARECNITYKQIRSKSKINEIVIPRQIAIWFSVKYKLQKFLTMGYYLNKDHTTIIFAYRKMERHIREGGKLKPQILAMEQTLLAAFPRTTLPADNQPHLGT